MKELLNQINKLADVGKRLYAANNEEEFDRLEEEFVAQFATTLNTMLRWWLPQNDLEALIDQLVPSETRTEYVVTSWDVLEHVDSLLQAPSTEFLKRFNTALNVMLKWYIAGRDINELVDKFVPVTER